MSYSYKKPTAYNGHEFYTEEFHRGDIVECITGKYSSFNKGARFQVISVAQGSFGQLISLAELTGELTKFKDEFKHTYSPSEKARYKSKYFNLVVAASDLEKKVAEVKEAKQLYAVVDSENTNYIVFRGGRDAIERYIESKLNSFMNKKFYVYKLEQEAYIARQPITWGDLIVKE